MSISKKFYSLVVAGLLAFSSASHAMTTTYDFGRFVTGDPGSPTSFAAPFATLSATNNGALGWFFLLSLNNLNSQPTGFGANAFVGTLSFDFSNDTKNVVTTSTIDNTAMNGVTFVESINGIGGGGIKVDFGTDFGQNSSNRLTGSESVAWNVTGLNQSSTLGNMVLHVQGLTGGGSAKYTQIASAIPEPETYAMLLAGLGLIGFAARRRKQEH